MNRKTGVSRILLTANLNEKQFRISVNLKATKVDFEKAIAAKSLNEKQRSLRNALQEQLFKAESIFKQLKEPSKEAFLKWFKTDADSSRTTRTAVVPFFDLLCDSLILEKRFSTAHKVRAAGRSFKNYVLWKQDKLSIEEREQLKRKDDYREPSFDFYFEMVDETFLKGYRRYMLDRDCSEVTNGMYLYHLRDIYHDAAKVGIFQFRTNPFENIQIISGERSKAVLYPVQLKKLWEYQPIGVREHRAKAFFFLCYLLNGINFKDLALLKWKYIKGDMLTFIRHKTKATAKKVKQIRVYLHEEAKRLIAELAGSTKEPDNFIFSWFNNCRDAQHLNATIHRHKRVTNKTLKKIGLALNFDVPLNLSLARHSFATKHKLDGTPVAFISEMMGHSATTVTEHYLKTLPSENLKLMSENLMKF